MLSRGLTLVCLECLSSSQAEDDGRAHRRTAAPMAAGEPKFSIALWSIGSKEGLLLFSFHHLYMCQQA